MTGEQYIRSNKVAYPMVMMTCVIVIATLLGALGNGSSKGNIIGQIVGILNDDIYDFLSCQKG